jgi:hypothetical protein
MATPPTNIVFTANYGNRGKSCSLHGSDTKRFREAIKALDGARFFATLKEFDGPGWTISIAKCAEVQELLNKINRGEVPETPEGAPVSAKVRKSKKESLPVTVSVGEGGLPIFAAPAPAKTQVVTYTLALPHVGQTATFTLGGNLVIRKIFKVDTERGMVTRAYINSDSDSTQSSALFIGDGKWMLWGSFENINVTFS